MSPGWHSGASGPGALDGTLATLRGERIQVIGVFADTTGPVQASLPVLSTLSGYDGDIDIALGGLTDDTPETWTQAARGAYIARWTQAAQALRQARGTRPGTVYVRFAHEANTDLFPWRVTSQSAADFRTSWRLFHDILAREFPQARLVFCANTVTRTDVGVEQLWPGDELVDVVAVDVRAGAEPGGLAAWLAFAGRHHKPFAVSAWTLDPGTASADDGTRVRLMHSFLTQNAAVPGHDPVGKVLYDLFVNYPLGTDSRLQITDPRNTTAAQTYRTLAWGTTP